MYYSYSGYNDIFYIIRRKRNNHDFPIYLRKYLNTTLLLSLNRKALNWNRISRKFLFIKKAYLQKIIINLL